MRKTLFAAAAALLLAGSMSSGAEAADKLKVGFIYLGTHSQAPPAPQAPDPNQFLVEWPQGVANIGASSSPEQ